MSQAGAEDLGQTNLCLLPAGLGLCSAARFSRCGLLCSLAVGTTPASSVRTTLVTTVGRCGPGRETGKGECLASAPSGAVWSRPCRWVRNLPAYDGRANVICPPAPCAPSLHGLVMLCKLCARLLSLVPKKRWKFQTNLARLIHGAAHTCAYTSGTPGPATATALHDHAVESGSSWLSCPAPGRRRWKGERAAGSQRQRR